MRSTRGSRLPVLLGLALVLASVAAAETPMDPPRPIAAGEEAPHAGVLFTARTAAVVRARLQQLREVRAEADARRAQVEVLSKRAAGLELERDIERTRAEGYRHLAQTAARANRGHRRRERWYKIALGLLLIF